MKKTAVFIAMAFVVCLNACQDKNQEVRVLQNRVDSLERQLAETYRPGFGEFMSGIQVHHAKLWFAGLHQKWKLADFEVHEIAEALEDIQKYQAERKESKLIPSLNPAIATVNAAIQEQSVEAFISAYEILTFGCNNCHRNVSHEFIVIKTPEQPPFSNQAF